MTSTAAPACAPKQFSRSKPYLTDLYEEFFWKKDVKILAEGAQGFGLDIDWGDYPFVTSSHCTVGGALLNGIPANAVRQVWGIAKMYETYVGAKKFQPGKAEAIFNEIAARARNTVRRPAVAGRSIGSTCNC